MCTWIATHYRIPLTIIRICSTYGPEGGAPADRLDVMLARKPIRLHPDKPNNYNPIYEDDYVELGIRAMEVADTPPITVNWAGSETVSVEEYCTYMGELVGVEPVFDYTARRAHPAVARRHPHARDPRQDEGAVARGLSQNDRRPSSRNRTAGTQFDNTRAKLMELPGTPSDEVDDVLATGRGDITTLFVSMATRHPDGTDAEYLRWHTLDHRPEQHRLAGVRASLRLVSTPDCRAARAVGNDRFDAVDHVMTYFFTDPGGLASFLELSNALGGAGRKLPLLPPVERGVYDVTAKLAAPRVKVGADVLPWWPVRGVYLLLERGTAPASRLHEVDGVAGVWSAAALSTEANMSSAQPGQTISYCFLDDDPVATAARLRPVLENRWADSGVEPLFAAPLYPVVPHEWDRYVP